MKQFAELFIQLASLIYSFSYALTAASLPFFEQYFGIQFKLPKIDMVAVPDFGFNGMEVRFMNNLNQKMQFDYFAGLFQQNWGLITFRESALLVPETSKKSSSVSHLQRVSFTLVHEIAHQWFGNLVTMKWYDDLWLKEGFSTYLQYVAMDKIKPDWNYFPTITINEFQKAMPKDCDDSSHPISFPVRTKSDVRRVFDPISYAKGALMVNMMRGFLGENSFLMGLRNYLNKYAYGNAVQDDLWEIMTVNAHKDNVLQNEYSVKEIMDTWTVNSAGFPVVTVTRNGTDVIISQHRYFLPKLDPEDKTKWFVPISYATSERQPFNEIPEHWLPNTEDHIVIPNAVQENDWIYLNINRTGYYRVNYDASSWKNLVNNFNKLPEVARAQLIDDGYNLARAEIADYDIPITLSLMITRTPYDYLSWWSFANGIDYLSKMLKREPAYESYRIVMRNIIKSPYDELGFDEQANETDVQLLHRSRIVDLACEFGIDRCTVRAQILFREWIASKIENK